MATSLSAGDIAIIGYNTDGSDTISFVFLRDVTSGTEVRFTDRVWNGTNFAADSAGEDTFTYTAGADLAAGTIVTLSSAQLSGAGISLADTGETIYAYQGPIDAPTTFLFAADIADGNGTFNGSLTNTGLSNGTTATAVAGDNAVYGDRDHSVQVADLLALIGSQVNWAQSDVTEFEPVTGAFFSAPDQQVWTALSGGSGIGRVERDGANTGTNQVIGWQGSATPATQLNHPNEIVFDTVHGLAFIADSDTGNRRILQTTIAELYNPGVIPTFKVLYTDQSGGTTGGQINGLAIDVDAGGGLGALYFVNQTVMAKISYAHDGNSTENQSRTVLANLGAGTFANEIALDLANNRAFIMSTASSTEAISVPPGTEGALEDPDAPGTYYIIGTNVTNNEIWQVSGLDRTDTSTAQTTTARLNFVGGDNGGQDLQDARGLLSSIDIDPGTGLLYFTTQQINGGVAGETGGIYRYNLAGGTYETLYTETSATDYGFKYIDVDPASGRYYVSNISFESPGDANGTSVNTSSILTHALSAGTPTEFMQLGSIATSQAPWGVNIQNAPTLNLTPGSTPTSTETAGSPSAASYVSVISAADANDVDTSGLADQLAGAQVRISAGFLSGATHQDLLTVNGDADGTGTLGSGISFAYNAATGVLTFSGAATFAEYEAALALVQFGTSGDNPTNYGANTTRTLAWSVTDGLMYSEEQTTTVNVQATNDAPVNAVGGTVNGLEDASSVAVTGLSVSDVDADPAGQTISVTLSMTAGSGVLNVATNVGGGLTAGQVTGNGTVSVTLSGTQNAINATLAAGGGLTFVPAAHANGDFVLTMVTNDGGNTGTPGALTDTDTKTIDIGAVNDAPVVVNGSTQAAATINEDAPSASLTQTVNTLFASHYSDAADNQSGFTGGSSPGAFSGVAVVANGSSASTGQWQYWNGAAWANIGGVAQNAALLIGNTVPLRFNPAADFNGTAPTLTVHLIDNSLGFGINFQVVDLSAGGATGGTTAYSTGTVVLSQTVTAVNDAPNVTDNTQSLSAIDEDTANPAGESVSAVFGASFSDADDQVAGGSTANGFAGVAVIASAGSASTGSWQWFDGITWTALEGVTAATAVLLDTATLIRFVPVADFFGTAPALGVRLVDDSAGALVSGTVVDLSSGTGDPSRYSSGTVTADQTINGVNDAPLLDLDGGTASFDVTATANEGVATVIAPAALVSDVDGTLTGMTVTLTNRPDGNTAEGLAPNASAIGAAIGAGLNISYTLATGVLTITGPAATSVYETILRGITYLNTSNAPDVTPRSITVELSDGVATSPVRTATVTVVPVNDAPGITAPGSISVTEDVATALTGLSFNDADAAAASVTVTLSVPSGSLAATSLPGVTVGGTASALTLTGAIADINSFIAGGAVSFTTAANATTSVTLTVAIDDGGNSGIDPGNSGTATSEAASTTVTLNVSAVNDAPQVNVPPSIAVTEDASSAVTGISFSDVDAGSANVTVVLSLASGTLSATSGGGVTVGGSSNALSLTGSIADINAFIAASSVAYVTAANATADVVLTAAINDGGNTGSGGAIAAQAQTTLTVTAINDAPGIVAPASIAVTEDVATAISGMSFSDTDAGSAVVTVTLSVPSGSLTAASLPGVTVGGTASALTLMGSIADINAFIAGGGVSFATAPNAVGNVTLTLAIDDGGNAGIDPGITGTATSEAASVNVTLQVSAQNDAPVNSVPGAQITTQDTALVFSAGNGNQISVSDVDAGAVQVTLTAANGLLTLGGTLGLAFSVGSGTGDATMTFISSLASINAALDGLSFAPTAGFSGPASIQLTTSDLGLSGAGGAQSDTDTIAVTVGFVNTPPAGIDGAVSMSEDTPVTLTTADFPFTEGDGNGLAAVVITTVPGSGSLTLNGAAVTNGQSVSAADITAGLLVYTPAANANGAGAASLTFQVRDDGGTNFGGVDLDATPNTLTFNIAAVNDGPALAIALADVTVNEDGAVNVQLPAGAFTDLDGPILMLSAALTGGGALPGWLAFDAADRRFTGTPPANFNGTLDITVTASDGTLSASDAFVLTIAAVNDAPVATADTAAVAGGATVTGNVTANDSDAESTPTVAQAALTGGVLQAVPPGGLVLNGTQGTLTLQANGSYSYAAGPNLASGQTASDSFTYVITDGALTAQTTLTVTVTGTRNGAPPETLIAPPGGGTLEGLGGNDLLAGGIGNDLLDGGAENDVMEGGPGNDTITGGAGNDTAAYVYAPTAVIVNLNLQGAAQATGGAGSDTLSGVENLAGSQFNDILIGDGGNNILAGDGGDDVLEGGGGIDTLIGDTGSDTAAYVFAGAGVTVSLALQDVFQDTGAAGIDFLSGIENLVGSAHADVLTGNAAANVISGGAGADVIRGGGGADILTGGAGADYFTFAAIGDSTIAAPDIITDFEAGVDKLDFRFIRTSPADAVSIATIAGYTMVTLDLGGNGTPDARVLLANNPTLNPTDILLSNPAYSHADMGLLG